MTLRNALATTSSILPRASAGLSLLFLIASSVMATACAADAGPEANDDSELRIRPQNRSCTLVGGSRPAGIPATDFIEPIAWLHRATGKRGELKAGTTLQAACGDYTFTTKLDEWSATVRTGQPLTVSPTYVGASQLIARRDALNAFGDPLGPTWKALAPTPQLRSMINFDADIPFPATLPTTRVFDLKPLMAEVELDMEPIDPNFPSGAELTLWRIRKNVRALPKKILLPTPGKLDFQAIGSGSNLQSFDGIPIAAAGTTSVIKIRRLEVDNIEDGNVEVVGTYSVYRTDGGHIVYSDVPTHTGVDLLPGKYRLEVRGRGANGQAINDIHDIEL